MKNMPNETAYNDTPAGGPTGGDPAHYIVMGCYDELCKQMDEQSAHQVIEAILPIIAEIMQALVPIIDDIVDALFSMTENLPDLETLQNMLDYTYQEVIPKRELPRPPRYLGPVNKANYTANRPMRRARSNCYARRRAMQ